jgi:hypothetical protein
MEFGNGFAQIANALLATGGSNGSVFCSFLYWGWGDRRSALFAISALARSESTWVRPILLTI